MTRRRSLIGITTCLTALLLLAWSVTTVVTIMVSLPYTRIAVKVVTLGVSAARLSAIEATVTHAGSGGGGRLGFLSADERSHMRDVAGVFAGARAAAGLLWALAAAVSIVCLITGRWRQLLKLLKWAVVVAEAVLASLLIVSVVDFDWLFIKFHRVFFPQGNWLFNPDSSLITLFPQSFWLLSTVVLVLGTALLLAGIGVAAHLKLRGDPGRLGLNPLSPGGRGQGEGEKQT